jgi:hypothetical protein
LTSENEEENNCTPEELEIVMEKIKNGKSPGEDGISSELCKYAGNKFHNRLLNFFNNLYTSKEIPTE